MLAGRLYRIFQYYAAETVRLDRPGPVLRDGDGQPCGAVERLTVEAGRLVAEGWAEATRVTLRQGPAEAHAVPVPPAPGGQPRFRLDLPFAPGPVELRTLRDGVEQTLFLPGFTSARLARARAARALPFAATLFRLVPVIWRWKRGGDLGARELVKEALSLVPRSDAGLLDRAVLRAAPPPPDPGPFTVVMPVYNAGALTQEALDRLEAQGGPWHLVLVEDASTEAGLRDRLQAWAQARPDRVTLILNETNLGFVGSVNRGLDAARARDPRAPVVLLNSDAMLPEGWAARLLAPLADPAVASVTPFSNDAEIFTVPAICARHDLRTGEGDALASAAAGLNGAAARLPVPTGVGFCMALSPRFLDREPRFDAAFGRGYGEEVDWCRKACAAGGIHVAAADLFVEHRGGASFGSEAKQRLIRQNGALISRRYPEYDGAVRGFIRADPLVTARLALGLSLAALRDGEVPVWLAHAMGGGAESDLAARIAARVAAGGFGVVLRVGQGQRWKLELHGPQGVTAGLSDDTGTIGALLARLPQRRVIYSCGVGDRDPAALPRHLLGFAGRGSEALPGGAQPVEVLVHDYFPVSPSYTLLGRDGVWRGVPRPGNDAGRDPAHRWRDRAGTETDLATWQREWGALIGAAERVEVFSDASRAILAEAYPDAAGKLAVKPHRLPAPPPAIAPGRAGDGVPVIGVLGNIGLHKGAALLERLSRDLARSGKARLVVIGRLDPDHALTPPSRVHGRYRLGDLPVLVARHGISAWLIPSVWPETFSFTTHEALATGLPVLAFDLGAQGAAVRAADNGIALPCPGAEGLDPAALLAALSGAAGRCDGGGAA